MRKRARCRLANHPIRGTVHISGEHCRNVPLFHHADCFKQVSREELSSHFFFFFSPVRVFVAAVRFESITSSPSAFSVGRFSSAKALRRPPSPRLGAVFSRGFVLPADEPSRETSCCSKQYLPPCWSAAVPPPNRWRRIQPCSPQIYARFRRGGDEVLLRR